MPSSNRPKGSSVTRPAAALLLALWAGLAWSATDCRLATGAAMAFGPYDVLSPSPTDSAATVVVRCTRAGGPQFVTVDMALGQGANGTSVNARRMLHGGGTSTLNYGLFRDPGRTAVWGFSSGINTVQQTVAIPNFATVTTTFTIYGRMPAQQDVPAGSYADSVQLTVSP